MTAPAVMTVAEVCAYIRIHRATIYRMIKRGEIPFFRIGYHYRFNREQIDAWREGQDLDPTKPKGR
jgi:excisionase family DNA binding protein